MIDKHSSGIFLFLFLLLFFFSYSSVEVSQSIYTKLSEYQLPQYRGYFFRKSNSNQMFCLDPELQRLEPRAFPDPSTGLSKPLSPLLSLSCMFLLGLAAPQSHPIWGPTGYRGLPSRGDLTYGGWHWTSGPGAETIQNIPGVITMTFLTPKGISPRSHRQHAR